MFVAIELEAGSMPNIANGLALDVAHVGVGRDVVAAYHDGAPAIDIEPFENERTRRVFGVEIGRWIGRALLVERGVAAPGQELALDDIVGGHPLDPVLL